MSSGRFEMELDNFSPNGVFIFGGSASFATGGGRLPPRGRRPPRRARVAGGGERLLPRRHAGRLARRRAARRTGGSIASSSRSGDLAAVWDGIDVRAAGALEGRQPGPRPVPGACACRRPAGASRRPPTRPGAGPARGPGARRGRGSRARPRAAATAARRTTTRPRRRSARPRAPRAGRGGRAPRPRRARTPKPHGITTTTSGDAAATSSQLAVRDFSPGSPSGSTPPASSISCGIQWPPTYGGASHSSAATVRGVAPSSRDAHRVDPVGRVVEQLVGGALVLGRLGEPAHVAQHLAERHRVERDHLRLGRDLLGDGAHVVDRDGADLAQRLGDDQVRLERRAAAPRRARRGARRGSCARERRRRSPPLESPSGMTVRVRCGSSAASGG